MRILIYPEIFVYFSDALAVLFLVVFYWKVGGIFWKKPKPLIAFLFLSGLSVFFALSKVVAAYNVIHLILLTVAAMAVAKILRTGLIKDRSVFGVLGSFAVLQAILGIAQFIKQGSIGLARFGEAALGSEIPGVAKIIVDGAKVVRAYGTLPHPNILAAFLLIGLCALYYLWLCRPSEWKIFSSFKNLLSDLLIGLGIFIVLLGLLFSFSRAAWVIAVFVTLFTVGHSLFTKTAFRQGVRLLILILAIVAILFINFHTYVAARARFSVDDPAVVLRSAYNKIGWEIIKNHPFGVGIGNQAVFTREGGLYQKFGLTESWQQQPIHNLYLLIASEIGILGLLALLIFVGTLMIHHSLFLIPKIMLAALLLFGLTDHFLWTSQSGMLMLWLVIGIVIGGSAHSTMDSAQPSEG